MLLSFDISIKVSKGNGSLMVLRYKEGALPYRNSLA